MTPDAFIACAMGQPKGRLYQVSDTEVVTMAPERSGHSMITLSGTHQRVDHAFKQ